MNAWLIGCAAALAIGFGTGWTTNGWRHDAIETRENRTRQITMEETAKLIGQIDIRNTTIRQATEVRVREIPVYRDCRHDAGVLQQLNAALQPPGDGKLPAADAAR